LTRGKPIENVVGKVINLRKMASSLKLPKGAAMFGNFRQLKANLSNINRKLVAN
jgi:hypothetical protein